MSILDRIAASRGRLTIEQRAAGTPRHPVTGQFQAADVQPLIASFQSAAPMAYTSSGVLPDTSTLAQWMQSQMDCSGGLKFGQ